MAPDTETRPEGHRVPARAELERYEDDAGISRADSGTPDRPPRIISPTHDAGADLKRAERDSYALDTATGVRRIVRQGDPIPPSFELLEEGEPEVAESPAEPDKLGLAANASEGYSSSKKAELEAEANRRGLEVEGTGSEGAVTKDDLVRALEQSDEQRQGEQPE